MGRQQGLCTSCRAIKLGFRNPMLLARSLVRRLVIKDLAAMSSGLIDLGMLVSTGCNFQQHHLALSSREGETAAKPQNADTDWTP